MKIKVKTQVAYECHIIREKKNLKSNPNAKKLTLRQSRVYGD